MKTPAVITVPGLQVLEISEPLAAEPAITCAGDFWGLVGLLKAEQVWVHGCRFVILQAGQEWQVWRVKDWPVNIRKTTDLT